MPELPEVEGARRLVERTCLPGKHIVRAVVADDEKVIEGISPRDLEKGLSGRTILAAKRLGKHLWLELQDSPALLLHFGMTGGLVVEGKGSAHYKSFSIDASSWPPRFCKVELDLSDGTKLAFCDSRRFARVRFIADPESQPPLSELGWDPLLSWPALEVFAERLAKQRRAVKAVLLDQSISAGVGNWVADEVLYQCRIHPEQPAASLGAEQVRQLHAQIASVCRVASEVEADADRLPQDWLFHVRWGKGRAIAKIGGHLIEHITVGGRTSAFVPALQKLDKVAAAALEAAKQKAPRKRAAGAPKAKGKKAAATEAEAAETTAEAGAGAGAGEEGGQEGTAAAAEGAEGQAGKKAAAGKARGRAGSRKKAAAAAPEAGEEGEAVEPAAAKQVPVGKKAGGRRRAAAPSAAGGPAEGGEKEDLAAAASEPGGEPVAAVKSKAARGRGKAAQAKPAAAASGGGAGRFRKSRLAAAEATAGEDGAPQGKGGEAGPRGSSAARGVKRQKKQ